MRTKSILVVVVMLVLVSASTVSATLQDGLLAYFPFNGNANDETGGNDGTVYGATLTTDRFGCPNSAYSFDGAGDYIDVANAYDFGFNNQSFSVSAWVQIVDNDNFYHNAIGLRNDVTGDYFVLSKARSGLAEIEGGIYAEIMASGQSVSYSDSNGNELPKNQWLHLVSVADCETSKLKLYIDNVLQSNSDDLWSFDFSSSPIFWIGTYYGDYYKGLIDDVRIYDRALTTTEVGQLYTIPEPATLLLLGLGAVMLRRKR